MQIKNTMKAKGGKAANAKRSPEERKALSEKMVAAKRELASLPRATHTGVLKLIDQEIPCAVLEDSTRILTQSNFMQAMGMYYSGWIAKNLPDDQAILPAGIPHFLAQKTLIPFINKHLGHLQNVVLKYKTERGALAHGIKAEIIPSICDVYIDAEKEGSLGVRQKQIAQRAMLLVRALAHVGIIALIDEATGYQADRTRNALAAILEKFVAKELQPYVKTFPAEFYANLFKLWGLPYPPDGNTSFRPAFFGKITNDVVYQRLAPGILPELKKMASQKRAKYHQGLTQDHGHPKLRELLASLITLQKLARNKYEWMDLVNKIHPKYGNYPLLKSLDHDSDYL